MFNAIAQAYLKVVLKFANYTQINGKTHCCIYSKNSCAYLVSYFKSFLFVKNLGPGCKTILYLDIPKRFDKIFQFNNKQNTCQNYNYLLFNIIQIIQYSPLKQQGQQGLIEKDKLYSFQCNYHQKLAKTNQRSIIEPWQFEYFSINLNLFQKLHHNSKYLIKICQTNKFNNMILNNFTKLKFIVFNLVVLFKEEKLPFTQENTNLNEKIAAFSKITIKW
eukprot:TRINITY_DN14057_c0_g1_i17.p1 TRINITY_DN14057_c0_g1~~TRINITY_DN14057_c0_g1_i17.p1  ORF type:complete len:219 (+),score=-20.51 TRINITY_DN14057_c0_g1_i17:703-1359(+)